jgi:hypothetical protein
MAISGKALAIDFFAISDAKDQNYQTMVFDLADEPVVAHPILGAGGAGAITGTVPGWCVSAITKQRHQTELNALSGFSCENGSNQPPAPSAGDFTRPLPSRRARVSYER